MNNIIDAEKIQKIIYYHNEARKSYNESIRQKKLCQGFLYKACQLILENEPFEYTDKELFTYSKDKKGNINLGD